MSDLLARTEGLLADAEAEVERLRGALKSIVTIRERSESPATVFIVEAEIMRIARAALDSPGAPTTPK